jgi:hypothetical protein
LRNNSLNPAASAPGEGFSAKGAVADPTVNDGVDQAAASAMPAFPDWQMNSRRVKEIGLIESDPNL